MNNQGITTEQARMIQMQQANSLGGGLCGSSLFGVLLGGLAAPQTLGFQAQQQAAPQSPFGGVVSQQIAQGSTIPDLLWQYLAPSLPCKPQKKDHDYSENLTKQEEKVPSFEERV